MVKIFNEKLQSDRLARESDVEKHLVKRVKELGGEVRKVVWVGRRNAPDRVIMLPREAYVDDHHCCIWVEVKRPGGKAAFPKNAHERAQHREHERMRAMGQRVEIVDSYQGVEELLQ